MHKIQLYNTLTRAKEEFIPIEKGKVSFYHCGPTVYWTQHIGNLRGTACADFIVRIFEYLGYKVDLVRNYTDVGHLTSDEDEGEDKMEKGAKREGLSPLEIANKYIEVYENDTKELNILEPAHKPRATECIQEMIDLTKILMDKGYAYATDLAIYFDVTKFEKYGELSGQKLEEKEAGAGAGDVSDPEKKNPQDFALWFFKAGKHKNALQYWTSPFESKLVENGEGFPGWHIECSAMSKKYLGNTMDIHMGGIEHIPVHHTNEIAQSEAANDAKFVNYWLHNEHLLVNDRKMAKSEGTSYSLEQIKEKGFKPLVLRYFFLGAHYRSKQNFTWEALEGAQNSLDRIYNILRDLRLKTNDLAINQEYKEKFIEKISDDFNTPEALAVVQEVLKSNISDEEKVGTIMDFDKVLGLNIDKNTQVQELPIGVSVLVEKRKKAREEKDFEESDKLRNLIDKKGYIVEDSEDGMRVYKK